MTKNAAPITDEEAFGAHEGGKLTVDLADCIQNGPCLSPTPWCGSSSRAITENPDKHATHTWADRLVIVLSDGFAVLGLGDIGPSALFQ